MTHVHFTRLIIETTSPMAITSGQREAGFDSELARDANGLPQIPASAIAGVWRHLSACVLGESLTQDWFGCTGQSARMVISHGVVHNRDNQPVVVLQPEAELSKDPLLALLLQSRPFHRERVRLNDRGVAAENGKFDQLLLPKGVRFCIDVRWQQHDEDLQQQWLQLLGLWLDRRFAFGSSTRNGLGQFKVVASSAHEFDLTQGPKQAQALAHARDYQRIPIDHTVKMVQQGDTLTKKIATLPLQALDNWRCGNGSQLLGEADPEQRVNIISYSEPAIEWQNNRAAIQGRPKAVLCGSSIKGILAHRITYHWRRHNGITAEQMADAEHAQWQQRPTELSALLGGKGEDQEQAALAGRLWVDDCPIEFEHTVIRHHNSIDRFTGGVRQGALFSEELLYQPRFTLNLWLSPGEPLSKTIIAALKDTFDDLQQGRLPLGAGSGRGTSLVMHDENASQAWQVMRDDQMQQELIQ